MTAMKRERLYVENRRNAILEKIVEQPGIRVDELAELFQVSPITVRRDLQLLESQNLLTRFYGGANPTEQAGKSTQQDDVLIYRDLIARYAATLVDDYDSLFINTSRTALDMVQYIERRNVAVITNNGHAIHTEHPVGVNIFLTGGELRYPKEAMVGELAEHNLMQVFAKKAFIGCSGISLEGGVMTEIMNEVSINAMMLERTTVAAYILADHTKIGKMSSFCTCSIDRVAHLITDEKAPEDVLNAFREKGISVHQVRKSDAVNL